MSLSTKGRDRVWAGLQSKALEMIQNRVPFVTCFYKKANNTLI